MTGDIERIGDDLIILKCHSCKRPTLFKLRYCHEADDHDYEAKSHCLACERDDPLKGLVYRKLAPALVKNQRCHVAKSDPSTTDTDRSEEGQR